MKPDALPTIWEVSDDLWTKIAPILAEVDPPKARGRKWVDPQRVLDAVIFCMCSGCQRSRLPKEYPDDSSVRRTYQRWVKLRVMDRSWAALVTECDELSGVNWEWQSADGAMGKARMGDRIGRNPTDRGKAGVKRSVLTEADGGPLAVVIAGANAHDTKLLDATLEAVIVPRLEPTPEEPQNLCRDEGYDNPTRHAAAAKHGYVPHIRRIGEEQWDEYHERRYPAQRWAG